MLHSYLSPLIGYFSYLASGVAMLIVFAMLYIKITPYDELKLVREGNVAAALSFGGALIGFSFALASSALHLNRLEFFVIWGALAGVVQIVVYVFLVKCIKGMPSQIMENNVSVGLLVGSISVAVGVINAGCLS
jgi:putative membrane protein